MVARSPRQMRSFALALVGAALAVSLFPAEVGARVKAGTFQGEGVEFAVKYYAGGVGGYPPEEAAAERSPEHTARVFFATPARSLLANVGLTVTDAQGRVIFRIKEAEPIIYLGLPKGTYTFVGSYHGATQRYPQVIVDPATRRDVMFVFPE